jgi:hypothetical protein
VNNKSVRPLQNKILQEEFSIPSLVNIIINWIRVNKINIANKDNPLPEIY